MKRRYAVKTRFVFSGVFFVNAESATDAKERVENHCGLVLGGGVHSTLPDEDVDWDFPVHPDKVIGRAAISKRREARHDRH
jgi:hypothetical protein